MTWIVDASVAIKWTAPEPLQDRAMSLLDDTSLLEAPDLLLPEAANTTWKKVRRGEMSRPQATAALASIQRFMAVIHPSQIFLPQALEMAFALGHPVYECFYLACAESRKATLVTADERLCRAAEGNGFASLVCPLRDFTGNGEGFPLPP